MIYIYFWCNNNVLFSFDSVCTRSVSVCEEGTTFAGQLQLYLKLYYNNQSPLSLTERWNVHVKLCIQWWQFDWWWTLPVKHVIHKYAVLASHQYKELVVVQVDLKMVARNEARIAHVDVSGTTSTRAANRHSRLAHQKLGLVVAHKSRQRRWPIPVRSRSCRRPTRRLRMIKGFHCEHFKWIFMRRIHNDRLADTHQIHRRDWLFLLLLLSQCQQQKWRPTGVFTILHDHVLTENLARSQK